MDGSEPISREYVEPYTCISQNLYWIRYIHELEQLMEDIPTPAQNNSPVHTTEAGSETSTIDNISSGSLDSHSSANEGIGIR